ncbi:MAG: type IV pilin N-terminal domain-containing protein [Methanolinea sp.]|nr:type IV pilin N-terminal domain-containing protein [Methanolinea sp.]
MIMGNTLSGDSGVSIVVGVMLMLVVTIILAAVVSAYAGGLITVKEKPLQVTITARVNGTEEILFDHTGGDQFSIDQLIVILDQGDQQIRITNATIDRANGYNLSNKAGIGFVRPGDTIILKGKRSGDHTYFNTTEKSISLQYNNREFFWTLLSQKSDSILSRGSLVFYS